MTTGERLAAYLSGDLDPDARAALEAELSGDAALRAELEHIRAADAALAGLADVELPEGFSQRLRDRVAPEVDAVLDDQLAARRARRSRGLPRWLPAVGAAAALAVVVAGGVTVMSGVGGQDTAAEGEDGARTTSLADDGEAADSAAGGSAEAMAPPATGPLVVDRGRELTSDELATLAEDPDVLATLSSDRVQQDPAAAAQDFAAALGGDPTAPEALTELEGQTEAAGSDEAETAEETASEQAADTMDRARPPVMALGDVSDEDRQAVASCLSVLFEDAAAPVVPLYAELATTEDGDDVIVYAALSPDADGRYQRVELWMVERGSCDLRLFRQSEVQPVDRNAP